MDRLIRDFGIVKPLQITSGGVSLLYNPLTQKKMVSPTGAPVVQEGLAELTCGVVDIALPQIRKYRVETTFACNSACDYCLVYGNPLMQLGTAMKIETASGIVRRFNKEAPNGSLMLIGGEPLTNLPVVVHFIENANGTVSLFTNATQVNRNVAKFLARHNVVTYVSLDGGAEENRHRHYLDGTPTFEDTLAGLKELQDAGAKVSITCLVTNSNVRQLEEIVAFFHKGLGVDSMGLSIPHHTIRNPFQVDIVAYTEATVRLFDYAKEHGVYIDQISRILGSVVKEEFRLYACKIVGEQRTFYPDGRETLCTKLDTLLEYRGVTASNILEKMPVYNDSCHSCEAVAVCGGGCAWDNHFSHGRDERYCHFTKAMLNKALSDIAATAPVGHLLEPREIVANYREMLKK